MSDRLDLLVPFDGSHLSEHILQRACWIARRDGAGLIVLCVATLPADETADPGPDADMTAIGALVRAQQICREAGVAGIFELRYARNVVDAIVREARRSGAVLIWVGLEPRPVGDAAPMSPTVQALLRNAPCSVVLNGPETDLAPVHGTGRSR